MPNYNNSPMELVLKTDTDNAKATLANAIVSKGGTATSSMTFAQLASAISNISTPPTFINIINYKAGQVEDTDLSSYNIVYIHAGYISNYYTLLIFQNTGIIYLRYVGSGNVWWQPINSTKTNKITLSSTGRTTINTNNYSNFGSLVLNYSNGQGNYYSTKRYMSTGNNGSIITWIVGIR